MLCTESALCTRRRNNCPKKLAIPIRCLINCAVCKESVAGHARFLYFASRFRMTDWKWLVPQPRVWYHACSAEGARPAMWSCVSVEQLAQFH